MSVQEIMRGVVDATAKKCGFPINFIWGDWTYCAGILTMEGMDSRTASMKYPCICLFLPFTEDKTDRRWKSTTSLELLIATLTRSGYTNEQRERESFCKVLRPIYDAFIEALKECRYLSFDEGHVSHKYSENYGYGSRGVMMSKNKQFADLIDGIDITSLELKIKKEKLCHRITESVQV